MKYSLLVTIVVTLPAVSEGLHFYTNEVASLLKSLVGLRNMEFEALSFLLFLFFLKVDICSQPHVISTSLNTLKAIYARMT